jgi:hypothetical protein
MVDTSFANPTLHTTPVVRWSAIAAGSVVASGLLIALYAMGLGCGFAAVNPDAAGRLGTLGLFAGTFGALVPLISLFVGGFVASRAANARAQAVALLHGATMWGLTALGLVWLLGALVSTAVGGTAAVASSLAQAGGSMASGLREQASAMGDGLGSLGQQLPGSERMLQILRQQVDRDLDIDAQTLLTPVNKKLTQAGRAPVKAEQLEAASRDVLARAMREKKLNREQLLEAVSSKTSIERRDAEALVDKLQEKFDAAQVRVEKALQDAKDQLESAKQQATEKLKAAGQEAAAVAARGFWGLFTALMLGLVAALGGSVVGCRD